MPVPLSFQMGFGMKVAVLPFRRATFFTMNLYHMRLSAIFVSESNFMSISPWPAVPTSWCCASISMPTDSITRHISVRISCSVSVGERGK